MKTKSILFALIVIMLAGSACTTYDRCVRKYGQSVSDTTIVTVEYVITRDSVITHIHIDSIEYLIPGQVYEASSERAKIQYWKDQYSNLLMLKAECDSLIIRDTLIVEATRMELQPPPATPEKKFYMTAGGQIATVLFMLCLLILLIKIRKK
jgi:hypothetical protein